MRQEECDYWDSISDGRRTKYGIADNIWKRQHIVSRLLESDLIGKTILEIGCGACTSINAVAMALYGKFRYVGTDVSEKFCEYSRKYGWDIIQTDVLNLPEIEGGWTRVVALDTLEHINPFDRTSGYTEINRVMAEHAKILINMPVEETLHDLAFDHPFDLKDVLELAGICKMDVAKYEPYIAVLPKQKRRYIWMELSR